MKYTFFLKICHRHHCMLINADTHHHFNIFSIDLLWLTNSKFKGLPISAIINNTATNILVHASLCIYSLRSWDKFLDIELQSYICTHI